MAGRKAAHLSGPGIRQGDWANKPGCFDQPIELFYPPDIKAGVPSDRPEDYAVAKSLCDRCGVKAECLDYAILTAEKWGMWGGLTPKERAAEKRRRERRRRQEWLTENPEAPDAAALP